jgi:hypothetical protein
MLGQFLGLGLLMQVTIGDLLHDFKERKVQYTSTKTIYTHEHVQLKNSTIYCCLTIVWVSIFNKITFPLFGGR